MILEEVNFLARNRFQLIIDVNEYKSNIESELPRLKGKRENLWRKYHKLTDENDKNNILKEIGKLTEKIDIIQAHKKACVRIIDRYSQIKEDYKNEIESKNKATELIKEDERKRVRNR